MRMISRRQFLQVAGVAGAAAALAACGGSSSSSAAGGGNAGGGNAGGNTAGGNAGGGNDAPASAGTIKVGVLGPQTGGVSVYGNAVINGALLYINQVNANGGVNGKQIEPIVMDEQGDETQAVNCFTQMVDQGITALVGDVTTAPTLAVVAENESEGYNMPIVTASATAAAVTYDEESGKVHEQVFRSTFIDPFQGEKMADYAFERLGADTAAVLYTKGADYQEGLAASFEAQFKALGGTIVASESYSAGDVDFKAQLTTIMNANPDVLYMPNYYEDIGMMLGQARDMGITVPCLGGDGWDGVAGYATAAALDGCFFCANYATGLNTDFEDAYKDAYGEPYPNGFAPLGYDAALTVVYGIEAAEAAGLEAGTEEYKAAVVNAIKTGTIEGITGTFTFDEYNNPVKTAAILTFGDDGSGNAVAEFSEWF